ncbi:MAG: C40 family peptidase [Gammaproteobacteria bacterium]|nr:C40 family peptidase [Gammaproteobacteria bacterium]
MRYRPSLLPGFATMWLAACASTPPNTLPSAPPPPHNAIREALLEDALGEIGRPYVYGGADVDGFDCSGLTHHVYAEAGVSLPRTAAQQRQSGRTIPFADAAPGDLVFYRFGNGLHVTIYVGHGKVVHAPSSGESVTVTDVDTPFWRGHYLETVRVLH